MTRKLVIRLSSSRRPLTAALRNRPPLNARCGRRSRVVAQAGSGGLRTRVLGVMVLVVMAVGCSAVALPAVSEAAIGPRPCDLYAHGGTRCVAAFSTTRAQYAAYDASLYQVKRASDGATRNIGVLPTGYADAAAQDRFCSRTKCEITVLFDQTSRHNNLTIEGPGGNGNQNVGVLANKLPITVGGREAYGMSFEGGMGYRDNHTSGVATGARPESMYMVTSGAHFNSQCCFDFGNAETNTHDTGNGHMDAIYFGSFCSVEWPVCYGKGPWVQADLENGLLMSNTGKSQQPSYTGNTNPFVTATLKNNGTDTFAIKDANAQRGSLATHWSGPLPRTPQDSKPPSVTRPSPNKPTESAIINPPLVAYRPMKKEGAIVLGTGGDDSDTAIGSFFEGVMTSGYATNAAENAVQANIVAAHYSARHSAPENDRPTVRLTATRKKDQLGVSLFCASSCTIRVRANLSRTTAKRLKLHRRSVILRNRSIVGSRSLTLRLPANIIRRARNSGLRRLTVTVTVTATPQDGPSTMRTKVIPVRL